MRITCPIRFKVSYNFTSISQTDVDVISYSRLQQLQRAGEVPTFTPTVSVGRGPVKIYFDFGAALPIRTSSDTSESILPVFIWVEDKGTGILGDILNYTENPYNALHLYVPEEFGEKSCDKFTEIISDKEGFKLYVSNQKIPMIKKKSPQLRCSFIMPNETIVPVEKAFFFSAEMNYTYDITGEKSIEVKPTLGV